MTRSMILLSAIFHCLRNVTFRLEISANVGTTNIPLSVILYETIVEAFGYTETVGTVDVIDYFDVGIEGFDCIVASV